MAKFRCSCGYVIRTSGEIPNPDEWLIISDVEYERQGSIDMDGLYDRMIHAYRCPRSGHLWIFWDGLEGEPSPYTPR